MSVHVNGRLTAWLLRISYVATLVIMGAICFNFYLQHDRQTQHARTVQALLDSLADADIAMNALAEKAAKIAEENSPDEPNNPILQMMLKGKSLKERKAFLASRPVDSDIISIRQALHYYIGEAETRWTSIANDWQRVDPALREQIIRASRYMTLEDPFKHHVALLDRSKLEAAKTKADMHWAGRFMFSQYDSFVGPSNQHIRDMLRKRQIETSAGQSASSAPAEISR